MQTLQLKVKRAALTKTAADVRAALNDAQALTVRADCFKAVTGAIPEGVLNVIDSVLRVATPIAAVLGDFELTSVLSTLKVWIEKKRAQQAEEDAQHAAMQNLSYSDWWNV